MTIALVAAVGAALLHVLPTVATSESDRGAEQLLSSTDTLARSVRVVSPLDPDALSKAPAIRERLERLFPSGAVDVASSGRASTLGGTSAGSPGVVLETRPDLAGITVVDGSWTTSEARNASGGAVPEVAVNVDAARTLGVAVGDDLVATAPGRRLTFRVAATWRASDPAAPRWSGDTLAGSGTDSGASGPVLIGPGDLAALPVSTTWTWTITATPGALAHRAAVTAALGSVGQVVHAGGVPKTQQVTTDGGLASTLDELSSAAAAARLLISIALALVAALVLLFTAQLGSLLVLSRATETALLRARGAQATQFLALSVVETLVVVLPSALIATVLSDIVLRLVRPGDPAGTATSLLTAAVVTVGTVVVLAGATWRSIRPAARTGSRRSVVTTAVLAAAAVLAAGLSLWRLASVGEPLVSTGGPDTVDPLAALSPLLAVVAGSLLGALLLAPLASSAARLGARRRGLQPALAAREVSRRHGVFAGPVFAVAVVVAATGFVSALTPTWLRVDDLAGRVEVGPSARLVSDGDSAVFVDGFPLTSTAAGSARGVRAATTVLSDTAQSGQSTISVIGVASDRVVPVLGNESDSAVLARTLAPARLPGLALPAGSRSIRFQERVGSSASPGEVTTLLWVSDDQGAVAQLSTTAPSGATSLATGNTSILSATLPDTNGPWRILAAVSRLSIDQADASGIGQTDSAQVSLSQLTATSRADADRSVPLDERYSAPESTAGVVHAIGVRSPEVVPATVTPQFAASLGVGIGDRVDLTLASTDQAVPARIAGIVEHVPGSGSDLAVAVDLRMLVASAVEAGEGVPNPNEVWVDAADSPVLAADLARSSAVSSSITTRSSASLVPVVRPAISAFWVAVLAAAVLAVLAVGAAGVSLLLARARESGALRSLGVGEPRRPGAAPANWVAWSCWESSRVSSSAS
ncbi:hypothetical protein GCM10025867_35190 [Frondihabitans sucicola]|uniref:FtsX-like permease family protein n=1 Tax=Frondihabitans sucicola TaxID=1268041 RepID=A0ABM8GS82_9MICO|nr:hypothetical protein [Frondihabitans sucicola]BDZ51278.1 hypothetical protein GCM10025867_35190 [Frondihabitans sucicola]